MTITNTPVNSRGMKSTLHEARCDDCLNVLHSHDSSHEEDIEIFHYKCEDCNIKYRSIKHYPYFDNEDEK